MALMSRFELWLWTVIVALAVLLTVLVARADAHPQHLIPEDGVMTVELAKHRSSWLRLMELEELNGPYREEVMPNGTRLRRSPVHVIAPPLAPAAIRALVEAYFPANQVGGALTVAFCESRYDPSARNGSHKGLFQLAGFWWQSFHMDPYDPAANVYMAHQIWLRGHPRAGPGPNWGHWVCQPDGSYWYF